MTAPAENTPEQSETPQQPLEGEQAADQETFSRDYVEKLRKENGDYRSKFKDAEKARVASLTDGERAVAEAEERGRTTVRSEYATRIAQSELIAEAAKRNPGYDPAPLLEVFTFGKYIGEDGEVDSKGLAAHVARLVPEVHDAPLAPSFDGGSRTPAPSGQDMNKLLRQATGRG